MKQIIRLTESDLHKLVKESVNKILKEVQRIPDPSDYLDDEPGNREDDDDEYEDDLDWDERYYEGR
jgi:hypothetical protein